MPGATEVLTKDVEEFHSKYDKAVAEVWKSEDQKAFSDFLEKYTEAFPTLEESVYQALYQSHEKLWETYTDFTLMTCREGKRALEEVEACRRYCEKKKLKNPFYERYYKQKIEENLEEKGMTATHVFRYRFLQDPELHTRYTDACLEKRIDGMEPDGFVENCREEYERTQFGGSFSQFYFENFYEYQYLYRQDGDLVSRYTDCTLMTLRDGMAQREDVEAMISSYRDDYEKEKPKKSFWAYFCGKYYGSRMEELPAREYAAKKLLGFCNNWRKTPKWKKQGYLFLHTSRETENVRNIAFHLAFAAELRMEDVQNLLKKSLLQPDFNPKNIRETIYAYCIYHGISYQEMVDQYLAYCETEDFRKKYIPDKRVMITETVQWQNELEIVLSQDKEMFYHHVGKLESFLRENQKNIQRKRPNEIFRSSFREFPQKVWTGTHKDAKALIVPKELYERIIKEKTSGLSKGEDRWLVFSRGIRIKNHSGARVIMNEYLKTVEGKVYCDNREAQHFLESDTGKHLQKNIEKEKKVILQEAWGITKDEEDDVLLPLILKKSRKNYFAQYKADQLDLLPVKTLKSIFGGLDYTTKMVRNRRYGYVSLSRTEIISTIFIGSYQRNMGKTKAKIWDNFLYEVNEELENCGLQPFYIRNPLELFIRMCFLYEDPLGYFLASMEKATQPVDDKKKT